MGIFACSRKDCRNILCDRYSPNYGYICEECFEELISALIDIEAFMNTPKNTYYSPIIQRHVGRCNEEFTRSWEGY